MAITSPGVTLAIDALFGCVKPQLDLIHETNVRQARGYAQYMEATTDGALAAFPAQELVRVRDRKMPRDWSGRWTAAGGRLYGGRMVALKTDPVWTKISRFGTPYPPFDFNSGMGVEDVGRAEAIALGVIKEGDPPQHVERRGFNDGLSAKVPFNGDRDELWLALRDKFGDQVTNNGSEIRWRTESIHESFENHTGFRMNCGKASEKMLRLGGETAEPFRDFKLVVDDNWLQRGDDHGYKHFKPVAAHPEDIVLNEGDLDLIPEAWRNPDRVLPGNRPGTAVCEIDTLDGGILKLVVATTKKGTARIMTMYKVGK